ncbi:flagellar motor switch protein FliN [Sphingomonas sp. RIT328]|uniref:flagellar motor switch protein FliN n=1 Tax=Sphingomonas sp. RIT328 TaxID=1470591 RepID=UPI00044E7F28|nr:flagellar motor switch protein FliN [Sphingomonas sp. RIT328]EZP48664.1 Flagellar motor switch protein [Sphingomonas sp. RIT328]
MNDHDTLDQDAQLSQLAPTQFDNDVAEEPEAAADVQPTANDLHAVFDVPVRVQAVLGRARMNIGTLLRLKTGDVVELDRRVGEPADIFVNNRLIARGEVVLIDGTLGVTLTEIIHQDRS